MATLFLASAVNGAIRFECDYNANNRRLQTGRVINEAAAAAHVILYEQGTTTVIAEATFQTGTTEFNVTNQQLFVLPDGEFWMPHDWVFYHPWAEG